MLFNSTENSFSKHTHFFLIPTANSHISQKSFECFRICFCTLLAFYPILSAFPETSHYPPQHNAQGKRFSIFGSWVCFGAHFLHLVISAANGRLRVLIIHLSHLKTATELLLKCILVHFFAFYRYLFFPPSFNEWCFALCSTSRLQFGIWEGWLDSKTVVTQRLLLIKPRRRAEWVQSG